MSNLEMQSRLINWGRYWRDTGGSFSRCRSIEHRYLPDRVSEEEAEDRAKPKPIAPDRHDADLVMAAWKKCSRKTKDALKWSYAMRGATGRPITIKEICESAGIMQDPPLYRAYDVAMYRAHKEIGNILALPVVRAIVATDNSRSSPQLGTRSVPAPSAVRLTAKETEVE